MGIEQPLLLPKSHAGDSLKNPVKWDTKKDLTKDIIIANFEALGLNGAVFTAGKSGKLPYGQIKKYFRGNDVVINPGTPTTTITGKRTEDLQFYYHPDHLGSSNYITDASGEVYQHEEYFPFGETFVEERNDAEYTNYLFNGKELDEETGLYYYGARYYDPRTSIFESVDLSADKYPGWSPYNYTLNSPLNLVDPDGKKPFPSSIIKSIKEELGYNALKRTISSVLPEGISWGDNCIESFNSVIQKVLFDKKQSVGSQIIGKNSTHEKLSANGRASGIKEFAFNDKNGKISKDNSTASELSTSIGEYIKSNYDSKEGGVKIYGFSVLDGYHSMLLTYGKNEDGELEFNLFDQGPATSFFSGNSTFKSAKDLDKAINKYVQAKQGKTTKNGQKYPAKAELFLIKNE